MQDEAAALSGWERVCMTRLSRAAGALVCFIALGSGLTGCDDQETLTQPEATPAICETLDDLRSSVDDLQAVEIGEGDLTTVQSELSDIQSELNQLPDEASDEYSGEIDAMRSAADSLESSVEAAVASPTSATLTAVADDVRALGSAFRNLTDAIGDTC